MTSITHAVLLYLEFLTVQTAFGTFSDILILVATSALRTHTIIVKLGDNMPLVADVALRREKSCEVGKFIFIEP